MTILDFISDYPCEEWDADGLTPEEVQEQRGDTALNAYMNWIYLNIK